MLSKLIVNAHATLVEISLWIMLAAGAYVGIHVLNGLGVILIPAGLFMVAVFFVGPTLELGEIRKSVQEIATVAKANAGRVQEIASLAKADAGRIQVSQDLPSHSSASGAASTTAPRGVAQPDIPAIPGSPEYIRRALERENG